VISWRRKILKDNSVTKPLVIRPGGPGDIAAINDLYNRFVHDTPITFDVAPTSLDQRRQWFDQFDSTGPYRIFVAERDGVLAGYAASLRFRKKAAYFTSVETSIYVDPKLQGSGVGNRLYQALLDQIADQGVHRAYAGITLPNEASEALHRKMGFEYVGTFHQVGYKFGSFWDVAWFEAALGEGGIING